MSSPTRPDRTSIFVGFGLAAVPLGIVAGLIGKPALILWVAVYGTAFAAVVLFMLFSLFVILRENWGAAPIAMIFLGAPTAGATYGGIAALAVLALISVLWAVAAWIDTH